MPKAQEAIGMCPQCPILEHRVDELMKFFERCPEISLGSMCPVLNHPKHDCRKNQPYHRLSPPTKSASSGRPLLTGASAVCEGIPQKDAEPSCP